MSKAIRLAHPRSTEQCAIDRRRALGRTVEHMMDERRMSFKDMAKAAGVSKTCIYQIVDAKVDARASTLWGIADFFGIALDDLYGPESRRVKWFRRTAARRSHHGADQ